MINLALGNSKITEKNYMKQDNFMWLQKWYQIHFNGNWEQDKKITLNSLDNPGWLLTINLKNT